MLRSFHFVGTGDGIPGLPHLVTDEEAKALGLSDVLRSAIANGNYVEEKASKPGPKVKSAEESA